MFADEGDDCDIPFEGENTPVNQAKCCNDERDVSYMYIAPIKSGYFNVKFDLSFGIEQTYNEQVNVQAYLFVNDKFEAWSNHPVGNNNHKRFGGKGYHAQFGIADMESNHTMIAKFKNVNLPNVVASTKVYDLKKQLDFTTLDQEIGSPDVKGACRKYSVYDNSMYGKKFTED